MADRCPPSTPRLDLIPLVPAAIEKLIGGDRGGASAILGVTFPDEFPTPGERDGFLPIQLERMRAAPQRRDWMARIMVSVDGRMAIGHCGFHGPPEMIGRAEIGYTVFMHYRGRDSRKERRARCRLGAAQGEKVYASVAPDNAPSLAVVRGLSFSQIGCRSTRSTDSGWSSCAEDAGRQSPDVSGETPTACALSPSETATAMSTKRLQTAVGTGRDARPPPGREAEPPPPVVSRVSQAPPHRPRAAARARTRVPPPPSPAPFRCRKSETRSGAAPRGRA